MIGRVCKSGNREDREEGVCNRVEVSEIPSFAFSTKAKEIIDPEKVLRVLETDFAETSDKKKPYSVEDERFLRILENGVSIYVYIIHTPSTTTAIPCLQILLTIFLLTLLLEFELLSLIYRLITIPELSPLSHQELVTNPTLKC